VVAPAMAALRDVAVGDRDVRDVLGFHPLALLRKVLSREQ
jgi:hypothetical protein